MGKKPDLFAPIVPKLHTTPEDGVWSPAREAEYFHKHWSGEKWYTVSFDHRWVAMFIDGRPRIWALVDALKMAFGRKKEGVN